MSSKRGAKPAREAATYAVSDVVLGKVRGYPPWPGMVVDPEGVSDLVAANRPTNKKTTFYCVRFFPNSEHAWLVEKDISRLKPHEIEAFITEPAKKKGDLLEAYRIAQSPTKWLEEQKAMQEAEEDEDEDDDEDADAEEVDQLESDAAAAAASASTKSKKRKRDSDAAATSASASLSTKAKKQPKSTAAKKEAGAKDSGETTTTASGRKKAGVASAKGKRNGVKSKAMVESEDEGENERSGSGAEDAGPSHKTSPPPAKKVKRDKDEVEPEEPKEDPEAVKVRDWRHKLQKTFLSAKVPPKGEDMPDLDKLFEKVEECDITIEQLQFSKIGKVMRHIAALTEPKVPRDAEYKFRERAKALVERWQAILTASKSVTGNGNGNNSAVENINAAVATAAAINSSAANGRTSSASASPGKKEGSVRGDEEGEGEVEEGLGAADVDAPGEKEDVGEDVAEATAAIDLNGKSVLHDALLVDAPAVLDEESVEKTDVVMDDADAEEV